MPDVDTLAASQARLHLRRQMWSGFSAAAVVVVLWSGFNIVSRLGGRSALTPFDLAALRYGISFGMLAPYVVAGTAAVSSLGDGGTRKPATTQPRFAKRPLAASANSASAARAAALGSGISVTSKTKLKARVSRPPILPLRKTPVECGK